MEQEYAPKIPMTDEPIVGKVKYCNIEMVNNGYVVRFDVREKKPGQSDMDHCNYSSKSYVFSEDQEEEAWEYFKKMKMKELKGE